MYKPGHGDSADAYFTHAKASIFTRSVLGHTDSMVTNSYTLSICWSQISAGQVGNWQLGHLIGLAECPILVINKRGYLLAGFS